MARLLWTPSPERIKGSNMFRFMDLLNKQFGLSLTSYPALYQWSIDHIPDFWASLWDFAEIKASAPYTTVIDDPQKMPGAKWFPGTRLNFAENLMRYRDEKAAIVFKGEGLDTVRLTYAELYDEVARLARTLKNIGVVAGDHVVGFMPNMPQTTVAMLAATSMGAVWSSCSPDFGIKGVLDRFGQIKPKILFTANGYFYKGKTIDSLTRIADIIKELPSLEKVVVVPYTELRSDISNIRRAVHYDDFLSRKTSLSIDFEQLPFEHPLYIMYSSGTTGLPKCMVQSAGGVLVNHLKELILHTDLKRKDTIFYYTTCGWMMWNWLMSSLAVGATMILFDGNPFYPEPNVLWKLADDEKITVFGTSAAYISGLEKTDVHPGRDHDLSSLRTVLSTGAPLPEEGFVYIYNAVKKDLQLSSICGGTDINGCFALGNPTGPVYSGEIQCRGLGMKVEAYDDAGRPIIGSQGELVCTAPSPSMPIYFWDDPDNVKYHHAYFDVFPGIWRHGDYIEISERGGMIVHGRSDATLNPGGVRIGSADIYNEVELFDEIEDSVVVGQPWKKDVRVVLFVKLMPGYSLTNELSGKIKATIRTNVSPRHVPSKIIPVPDIPYTLNMKKVEVAVRKIIQGLPVLNRDALSNPEALDYFARIPELQEE